MQEISETKTISSARMKFLQFIQTLPDDDPSQTCFCGRCDGYGNLIITDRSGVRRGTICPHKRKSDTVRHLNDRFADWEGWKIVNNFTLSAYMDREDFLRTEAFDACANYLDDILSGKEIKPLILLGSHGRSKSLAPLFVLKECASYGYSVHAFKWPELIDNYQKGIDGRQFIESNLRAIDNSYFVFIDEYGRNHTEKFDSDALRKILEKCYRKKWLIITSNMKIIEFKDSLDGYAFDRLKPNISTWVYDGCLDSLRLLDES